MVDLTTRYAGLKLKSPIIVSSSGLTQSVDRIEKIASAGAGAVVLKSLFEEQIRFEIGQLSAGSPDYPEAHDYLAGYARDNSLSAYLNLVKEAKARVDIPVIASVNCVTGTEWVSFTKEIEKAGADAIELNVYFLPIDKNSSAEKFERVYYELVTSVKATTNLPVIVKLGNHFTNPVSVVDQLRVRGADAVVLFNRFYAPDIDPETLSFGSSEVLSSPADIRDSLRWVGIISSEVETIDIAASTGIHSGMAVVKQILAGAAATQVCSVLYRNGIDYLREMTGELKTWMEKKGHHGINEIRGKMNYTRIKDPAVYERAQFIRYFSKMS